jgi:hypothetical protein
LNSYQTQSLIILAFRPGEDFSLQSIELFRNLVEFRGHVSSDSLSLHDIDVVLSAIAATPAECLKKLENKFKAVNHIGITCKKDSEKNTTSGLKVFVNIRQNNLKYRLTRLPETAY